MPNGKQGYRPVPGSHRAVSSGARRIKDASPQAPVAVTVVLRRRSDTRPKPASSPPMDRAEAERVLGADPADVETIEDFAHQHGLTVTSVDMAARSVGLAGTVAQMNAAFEVDLGEYRHADTVFRGREGDIQVPDTVAPVIRAVLGLDERQQARAHFRVAGPPTGSGAVRAHAASRSFAPQEVARRYGFPTDADGTGQTVAVIELGGALSAQDIKAYFTEQGLRTPKITPVSVDGAHYPPGGDADGEVALDVEVIGAIAQGARQVVYFGLNTTRGFYNVIAAALHDRRRKPSVVSISWGGPESSWTAQSLDAYDELFADAAALGVSVFCASGDDGASDRVNDGSEHVDFPASSPNVIGCGGTKLTDTDETTWNEIASGHGATGGGVSRHFPLPAYQSSVPVPVNPDNQSGRGVPDVAGDADPLTGYQVRVGGQDLVIGGTSAVAPLWAALTAIANEKTGRAAGALHDLLYGKAVASAAFRDIVQGDNGHYNAGPGWDACTGLGSPIGDKLIGVLADA
jgi:kumamolisin